MFNFNHAGHMAKDCRVKSSHRNTLNKQSLQNVNTDKKSDIYNNNNNNMQKVECYSCHKFGHIAKNCCKDEKAHPNAQGLAGDHTELLNWD